MAGNLYFGSTKVCPVYLAGNQAAEKYGCTVDNLLGDVDANGVLQMPTNTSGDIVFTGVKDIVAYGLYYRFNYCSNLTHAVSFPDLENVPNSYCCAYTFYNSRISSISFPKLKTISGSNAMQAMCSINSNIISVSLPELTTVSGTSGFRQVFQSCTSLATFSLPKLQEVSGNFAIAYLLNGTKISTMSFPLLSNLTGSSACQSMFGGCRELSSVYFNALTTSSFGSNVNQFQSMFDSNTAYTSGSVEVHFPSNLETTIQGLTGYPLFGGNSGRITLLFDLQATS